MRPNQAIFLYGKPCRNEKLTETAVGGFSGWQLVPILSAYAYQEALLLVPASVLMVGAYGWAFINPLRKLWYNLTITAASVLVAMLIGGIEALGLLGDQLALTGPFWNAVSNLNDSFGYLGFAVIGIFVACWIGSTLLYRWHGYDQLEVLKPS